jgi:hypothetical protein
MGTIESLEIAESKIGDLLKSFEVEGLCQNGVRSLIMKRVENTVVENLMRYVVECLKLGIEEVVEESLVLLKGTRISKVEMMGVVSTGSKSIREVTRRNFLGE